MIDLRFVREHPDTVRASQRARGEDEGAVDTLLTADARRRAAALRFDTVRNEQKTIGRDIAKATGDAKQQLLTRGSELSALVKAAEASESEAEDFQRIAHLRIANVVEDGAPAGGEANFVVLEHVGQPKTYDFPVRDHLELGEMLRAIDTERGAKVSGARFYYLTGVGALLELALVNLAVAQAVDAGFTPIITPALVKPEAMEGTGFLGAHNDEIYYLPADDLYLVGTSEVPLAAYHSKEILDLAPGQPRRYAGFSSCFRREAGSYGKDTRGIIRVHQFDKVEMFSFCAPEDAHDEHLRLLAWEKEFLNKLEVPFRVIDVAAGDLGSSAARKYDCEAWIPSQGAYREVTSASNCTDFQARRLDIRMPLADGKGTRHVATLNGTLCAVARSIVAVLENHQQADGSVVVPAALRPYLGGREVLAPV